MTTDSNHALPNSPIRDPISHAEKELELERLLRCGIVREGTQLYQLLSYLGRRSLTEENEPLKEYKIGVEALGKPADYDPRIDPTVRVEVGRLRKKLKEHYQDAGSNQPIKLFIPKGSYLPTYVAELPQASLLAGKRMSPRHITVILSAAVLVLAVLLATTILLLLKKENTALSPELAGFWAPHLDGSAPTLIVYGTPLFVKIQGSFYRDPHLNRIEELDKNMELRALLGVLKPQEVRPLYNFTGVGEAEALFLITNLLSSGGAKLLVQRSDTLSWEDLKDKHVIFLGGSKFNPQLPDLPVKPKFEAFNRGILNLHPKNGEPAEYSTIRQGMHGEIKEDYALVSVYPGLNSRMRIVVLDCHSTKGTMAAAEFVTRQDTLRDLYSRAIFPPGKEGQTQALQIVVGAKFNNGVVVSLFYVTHCLLD